MFPAAVPDRNFACQSGLALADRCHSLNGGPISPDSVNHMLGHFSAGFTLDTYAHVTTTAQKEAAQNMGNVLSP